MSRLYVAYIHQFKGEPVYITDMSGYRPKEFDCYQEAHDEAYKFMKHQGFDNYKVRRIV